MKNNEIDKIDGIEKVVTDLLLYIEKESDILFDITTIERSLEMVSIESGSCKSSSNFYPCKVYSIYSIDSYLYFAIYVCDCERGNRIIEIVILPIISAIDEGFIQATKKLKEILPNIPITHDFPQSENNYEEDEYEKDDHGEDDYAAF